MNCKGCKDQFPKNYEHCQGCHKSYEPGATAHCSTHHRFFNATAHCMDCNSDE